MALIIIQNSIKIYSIGGGKLEIPSALHRQASKQQIAMSNQRQRCMFICTLRSYV